ncbi:MAG: GTP cyclohydrolase IIa [Halobacteriales archaeon]|nr:GTP cyclohydrolase IIa [Halobacteriales archaeon]
MAHTQVTLVQIDNYGPWTVTPHPRREADLQSLQSRLYADLSELFGVHGGYVFFTRFDNMIGITNGIDRDTHRRIQESIRNRYPVTISFSIATRSRPDQALNEASTQLQAAGSAQDETRTEILRGETLSDTKRRPNDVQVAHFDVDNATEEYTDDTGAFEAFRRINRGYVALLDYMYEQHNSLSFFIGGDNILSITPELEAETYRSAVTHVQTTADIQLKVGVGWGQTAHEAGMIAKEALEECREAGTQIEVGDQVRGEG